MLLLVSNGDGGDEANYKVVDTDYDNYAIVYDCSPFPLIKKGKPQNLHGWLKSSLFRISLASDKETKAQPKVG